MAETSYAKCGDLSLAYQVFGDGPVELVFVGPMVFHVELFWAMPEFKAFFDQLATFCRVVMFDKAGNGLSDPIPKVRLLEERAAEIEAVMDAVGFGKPVVFGTSEGGPQALAFTAKRPERTRALILYGSFAFAPPRTGTTSRATRPSCGRASLPTWVRTTRRRRSRSPASRNFSAPSARRGAAAQQRSSCFRRSARYASSPCSSACAQAVFLDRLGRLEPAATIAGFAFSPFTASTVPQLSTAITHLRDVLGDQTYESLAHKGETMTTAVMATYAYDQIDKARAELDAVSK